MFVLSIRLLPYFMYANSEGSDETAYAQARQSLHCSRVREVPKFHVQVLEYTCQLPYIL